MDKVQVDILGLSENPKSKGAYALVLRELEGPRRLPIVIGQTEAMAIVTELEGNRPPRPMTHDLLKNVIEGLGATLRDVCITTLTEGTFYAVLNFEYSGLEIDARPSDAIALAVRFSVPIFVNEDVLSTAGFSTEEQQEGESFSEADDVDDEEEDTEGEVFKLPQQQPDEEVDRHLSYRQRLERDLEHAIRIEDYETAARIRDELGRIDKF